ncbi:MAG: metallophosphoesterase [bacterium]
MEESMKIGVMSDTHDNLKQIEQAVKKFNDAEVKMVIHAGDFVAPFSVKALQPLNCPVVAVFGNNDGDQIGLSAKFKGIGEVYPVLARVELDGRKIAVVHYPELAESLFLGKVFDVVVYGHTHKLDVRKNDSGLLLNPGETGGWSTGESTVAIIDLKTLTVDIQGL